MLPMVTGEPIETATGGISSDNPHFESELVIVPCELRLMIDRINI